MEENLEVEGDSNTSEDIYADWSIYSLYLMRAKATTKMASVNISFYYWFIYVLLSYNNLIFIGWYRN